MSQKDSIIEARLATRESSTLSFAALGASSSLIVLALTIERGLDTCYPWLKLVGVLFAFLGVLYREATCFSTDKSEPKLESKELQEALRSVRKSEIQQLYTFTRRFTVRYFLNLPVVAWLAFMFPLVASYFCLSLVLAAITPIVFSIPNLVPPVSPE